MRVPQAVQRVLRRFDVQITHYSATYPARRAQLLESLGICDLVDVGANAGQYADEVRFHGYAGNLWSFEPLSGPYEKLAIAAERDPRWSAYRMAVSSESSDLVLYVSRDSVFSSAIPLASSEGRPDSVQVSTESVRAEPLDQILPTLTGLHGPLGLKVDVQGHEGAVFDGAAETLKRVKFLEFEMSCVEIYKGQALVPELMQQMYDLGFVLTLEGPAWAIGDGRALQMNGIFVRQ